MEVIEFLLNALCIVLNIALIAVVIRRWKR